MTFADLYNEVVNLRFNNQATKLAQVKRWLNAAEIAIWNAADWEFRRVPASNLVVSAPGGLGIAAAPTNFGKAIRLYDPRGYELQYLAPDVFEREYVAPVPLPSGNAEAWTVINRDIHIGPGEEGTYKLAYRRRYTKINFSTIETQGVMANDFDMPLWDSEHHYILVPWAMRLGEVLEADPTSASLDQVVDDLKQGWLFRAMVAEHVGGVEKQVRMWGEAC